jgi:hypothetical protein
VDSDGFDIDPVRSGTPVVEPASRSQRRRDERPRGGAKRPPDPARDDGGGAEEEDAGSPAEERPVAGDGIDILA